MKKIFQIVFFIILISITQNQTRSQVPEIISYQCFVKGQDNSPLNGVYTVSFSLYEKLDSKDKLWTEIMDVAFVNGYANVYLGKITPLSNIDFNKQYWMGITIGTGNEFQPRIALASSPYSMTTKSVDPTSGGEGNVLTIIGGKSRWAPAGGLLKLPFIGSSDTSGPAMQIHQIGRGSSGLFTRQVVPQKSGSSKNNDIPQAIDSNFNKPVVEVKEEHKLQGSDSITSITSAVFGSHGGFSFVPFLKNKKNGDDPLNIANYSGTKTVGFFCLDSVFGVNRYNEIEEDYPTSIYARTLARVGNAGRFITEHKDNENATIYVKNNGTGQAAVFHSNNENADFPAVAIRNKSLSNSLAIFHDNPNNHLPAIAVVSSGNDDYAIYSEAVAKGGAAKFVQSDSNQFFKPCLTVRTVGITNAATFFSDNPNSYYSTVGINSKHTGKSLYISSTNSMNDSTAFQVEQDGRGPSARFYVNNSNNSAVAVVGNTWGLGRAGQFAVLNTNNQQTALGGITVGTGTAISGYTNSTKAFSGVFYTDNTQNTETCLYATTTGQGFVGEFVSGNVQPNSKSTVYAGTTGMGNAGEFVIVSNDNSRAAVYGYHNNKGTVIYGKHEGTGRVASFEQMNQNNAEASVFASGKGTGPTIYAKNEGRGIVAQFNIPTGTNTSTVLIADNQNGRKAAVIQSTAQSDEPALEVRKDGTNKQAALFAGNVQINGTLTKQSGAFMIDHPLDPENKYLSHSFVESPDMKNIYDGIVILDSNGEAIVELPEWFQALNKDFRYQLTCIGGYAQVYIAQEIENNNFKIAGGRFGLKVSWQVTGIRHDKYAEKYPIVVEKDKPENEKGTLLCPDNPSTIKMSDKYNQVLGLGNNYQNLNIDFNMPDNKEKRINGMLLQNDIQRSSSEGEILGR